MRDACNIARFFRDSFSVGMSPDFLAELSKPRALKPTSTKVTRVDGSVSVETRSGIESIARESSGVFMVPDDSRDDTPACILPGLFLGSQDAAANLEPLRSLGIRRILNCAIDSPCFFPDVFDYLEIPLYDEEDVDLGPALKAGVEFIEKSLASQQPVLVHCIAGASRSASVVIAYLMLKRNMSFEEAYTHVKSIRPAVQPNRGFVRHLQALKPKH